MNMSLINWFFSQDPSGRRKPTPLTIILILILFIVPYYLKKKRVKTYRPPSPKEEIIKREDMIEKSHSAAPEKEKTFLDDISLLLSREEAKEQKPEDAVKTGRPQVEKLSRPANTPMLVYDATNNYQSDKVVPLGSMIKCLLIHNIVTNNFSSPVIAQVWNDFYFHDLLLPFGTRIYGTARAGKERDRVLVVFHTIVFQNGKEIKIKAIGLSQDGSAGLTGIVINQQNKKRVMAMLVNFLSGLALGFQDKVTNAVTGIDQAAANSRNAILEGVGKTFEEEAKRIQKEIENAEGYAVVSAGSNLIVYFEQSADVNPL
jgi:type IV secretory pathway VirB10-like protein